MSVSLYQTLRNPIGPSQTVAYTGTAGSLANALPVQTQSIMVICTSMAFVKISFGTSVTAATATDIPIAPNIPVILPVNRPTAPQTDSTIWVSAIQSAAGGNLHVQPLGD